MFPRIIDTQKIHEKTMNKPVNHWDYQFFENYWYPKKSYKQVQEECNLERMNTYFPGKKFRSVEHATIHANNWIDRKKTEYVCQKCGFKTSSEHRLENHANSSNCELRQKRLQAQLLGTKYIPPCLEMATCQVCNLNFTTKYCLNKHLKTKKHKDACKKIVLPTHCKICDKDFDKAKFKRHLKSSKKCHRLCRKNGLQQTWLNYHELFACKFPRQCIEAC